MADFRDFFGEHPRNAGSGGQRPGGAGFNFGNLGDTLYAELRAAPRWKVAVFGAGALTAGVAVAAGVTLVAAALFGLSVLMAVLFGLRQPTQPVPFTTQSPPTVH